MTTGLGLRRPRLPWSKETPPPEADGSARRSDGLPVGTLDVSALTQFTDPAGRGSGRRDWSVASARDRCKLVHDRRPMRDARESAYGAR